MFNYEFPQWVIAEPDPKTICTLCKGVFDKQHLIECPAKINVCIDCANILKDIAAERETAIQEKAIEEMLAVEKKLHDCYEPRDLMRQLYREGYRREVK